MQKYVTPDCRRHVRMNAQARPSFDVSHLELVGWDCGRLLILSVRLCQLPGCRVGWAGFHGCLDVSLLTWAWRVLGSWVREAARG
jgi:hypothetical protein